jgi:hypothetical protein
LKRKKVVLNENYKEDFPEIVPSMLFCQKCKLSDFRAIKDKFNEAVMLIRTVAVELDIDENYDATCKALLEWVGEQRRIKEMQQNKKKRA